MRYSLIAISMMLIIAAGIAGLKWAGRVELWDQQHLLYPTAWVQILAAAGRGEFGTGDFPGIPNDLDLSGLQPGDIILGGNPGGSYGHYTHAGFYIGNDQVVDMYTSQGVYVTYAGTYHRYSWAAVLRVKASPSVRAKAVAYVEGQVGAPFFILTPKCDDGLWYCSKLAWYAYYRQGIDLDAYHNSYWVVPDALLASPNVTVVSFASTPA
jgi:uncharacterized protein YycO